MEAVIALVALTAMEIVLGIDNIVFIALLSSRLPADQQSKARRLGLLAALVTRVLLLLTLKWILGLEKPLFELTSLGVPKAWLAHDMNGISVRDLILLAGGLFLVFKSVHEIHAKIEGSEHEHSTAGTATFGSVIAQIAVIDIVFSLDSVITAVGMAKQIWVMIAAVIIAVGVMVVFADKVSHFVEKHPTLKMLALSFLILIGVMLIAEGIGTHFNKGYIYFAMAFALAVEVLNIRSGGRRAKFLDIPSEPSQT
ncbi:MAG: TerC family protein [Planctomycetales bacterium]|nr:TerC family protein [Planctomycetales bacterium]